MSEPIRIAYGEDASQFGDLRFPTGPGPHPVVILIHGGFWRARYGIGEIESIAKALPGLGLACWNIEYRRVGQNGGGWPGTLYDVGCAADHVKDLSRSYPLDLRQVVTMGHSAGGHLALWLAARRRIPQAAAEHDSLLPKPDDFPLRGVLSLAGVSDLEAMAAVQRPDNPAVEFLGGTPAEVPGRYFVASPAKLLPLGIRQVLIHGDADDCVPVSISRNYTRQARAAGDDVSYVELPGVGHFELRDANSPEWQVIKAALQNLF